MGRPGMNAAEERPWRSYLPEGSPDELEWGVKKILRKNRKLHSRLFILTGMDWKREREREREREIDSE